jgi:hypothetical protein
MGPISTMLADDQLGLAAVNASLRSTGPPVDPDKPSAVFRPVSSHDHFQSGTGLPTSPGLGRLNFAMARRRVCHEGVEQLLCCPSDLVHGSLESNLVCLGRSCKATQLADELQRRCSDFVLCRWRSEVMESLDRTTHDNPRLLPRTTCQSLTASPSDLQRVLDAGHGMPSEPDRVAVKFDRDAAVSPNTAVLTGEI